MSEEIYNPLEEAVRKTEEKRRQLGRKLTADEAMEILDQCLDNPEESLSA